MPKAVIVEKTAAEELQDNMLKVLAELGGQAVAQDEIAYGPSFQLPELYRDNLSGAIDYLIKFREEMEEPQRFTRSFPFKPWDGAVAVQSAFRKYFGTNVVQRNSFFEKAQFHNIPISPTEEVKVPFGTMVIPIFRGTLRIQGQPDDDGYQTFVMIVDAPKKFQYQVEGLFRMVQDELDESSIYRGKAIDGSVMPNFLDLTGIIYDQIIYSELTLRQLSANLWVPITHPQECLAHGLDPKRAVLLQGPYGTGKTLGAMWTAKLCEEQNRTFVMCNPKDNNAFECLKTAALYQPSCLFVEDIDKLAATDDREAMARLLDEFDGFRAKGRDIMIVLTTNRVGEIHKGMLRPGRMDAVIEISKLDLDGMTRLIKAQFDPNELDSELDYERVYKEMEEFTPAFMKEVCQKVKLYSIARAATGEDERYNTLDFLAACEEMRVHYNLHTGAGELKPVPSVDRALEEVVGETILSTLNKLPISYPDDGEQVYEIDTSARIGGVK